MHHKKSGSGEINTSGGLDPARVASFVQFHSKCHPDERWRMQKAALWQLKDELIEVFGRHPKRIHQRRLYCARYFGDPRLVVAALDNMDFGERT